MKKIFSIASLLLVAALAFTSCSKDENNAPEESVNKSFSIVANLNDTKVTIDNALKSSWSDGDQMNVFHAAAGTTTYTNDNAFSYAEGRFTGELGTALTDGASYDWYAFYPFSSHIKTPANTSSGYMPVGSNAGVAQVQNGNDNPAHIAGSNYPLVGKVENVANNVVPSVTMKHVCSYAKVVVTNTLSEPIKVSKIEVAMPGKNVTGTYFVNFVDPTNCTLKGSGTTYVSDKAVVEVTNGSEIAAGASASFYLGFVPQALVSGDELTVNVTAIYPNSDNVTATQTNAKVLTSNVSFNAGHIKTLNISYNTAATSGEKSFVVKSLNIVNNNSAYGVYSNTVDGREWTITHGGNKSSVGTNSSKRTNCKLTGNNAKYAVSPVTSSSTASAFACKTKIDNVSKISYSLTGGSGHTTTKVYVIYSTDNTTFSQVELTSGTQGGDINTTTGETFEFKNALSGYFAVLFEATSTSGNWRLDNVELTITTE